MWPKSDCEKKDFEFFFSSPAKNNIMESTYEYIYCVYKHVNKCVFT
jgi:hypothetical protein